MIISASRREDMPAHRPEYLAAVLREKKAETRNPFNPSQRKIIDLSPESVDGIVLWSKNPQALLTAPMQNALAPYAYYVQFTLNGYARDIEPGVPPLAERLDTYRRLADALGPERVRWRYDPIALTPSYPICAHAEIFGGIAGKLAGYAKYCTISFMDVYRRILKAMRTLDMRPPDDEEARGIAKALSAIGSEHGISLETCAEAGDYSALGIAPARCVDAELLSRISGRAILWEKDTNQRPHCGCARAVDLGSYGSCPHACAYCYARRPSAQK